MKADLVLKLAKVYRRFQYTSRAGGHSVTVAGHVAAVEKTSTHYLKTSNFTVKNHVSIAGA
jgi:hypothetical protein